MCTSEMTAPQRMQKTRLLRFQLIIICEGRNILRLFKHDFFFGDWIYTPDLSTFGSESCHYVCLPISMVKIEYGNEAIGKSLRGGMQCSKSKTLQIARQCKSPSTTGQSGLDASKTAANLEPTDFCVGERAAIVIGEESPSTTSS